MSRSPRRTGLLEHENTTSRLKTRTDAQGQTTQYRYAKDDATTAILYNNSQNPTDDRHFVYDSVYPRMMAFDNGQGQTNLSYIPAGQPDAGKLAEEATPDGYRIDRRYDALGRLQGTDVVDLNNQSHPSALSYDELNRLVQNMTELGPFQYGYDHDSPRLSQLRYPNQTQTQYTYFDALGDLRLKTLDHLNPSDTLLAGHSYQYDAEGQIRQWQRLGSESISEAFRYDVIGQLRQVDVLTAGGKRAIPAVPGGKGQPATPAMPPKKQNGITTAFAYGYDAVGNRLQETVGSQTTAATYNDLNQLLTNGSDSYNHDDDGNQRERHSATLGRHSYLWDAENRLVVIEDLNNPATRSDLAYDAIGRRIGIKDRNNGTTTKDARLIYCGTTLCAENDYLTNSFSRYYGDGAAIDGPGVYYHRDHLGSVRAVTDAGGTVKTAYAFDPYGRRTTLTGNAGDSVFGYTRHYVHQASGLALAPYRAYDAEIGRWLSRDPIGELGGINLYSYVGNDPINLIDPTGLLYVPIATRVAIGVAARIGLPQAARMVAEAMGGGIIACIATGYCSASDQDENNDNDATKSPDCPPKRVTNPKHHPNSNSPEPDNVDDLFDKAIADREGRRWAKDEEGVIHRFSKPSNGETHWNGSTGGKDPIRIENIPMEIRRQLR